MVFENVKVSLTIILIPAIPKFQNYLYLSSGPLHKTRTTERSTDGNCEDERRRNLFLNNPLV